ncbi:energy transducer TonB [Sporomusa sp. KB1]|jgi:protein TonB|uniref:energy transducer TonB n=1 Tax=Sporomusa sp. KB1 TaxID=943346 RepID=UPI00119EDB7B|nr:energy transducer TonB [Sporomusa sp. KB1]TWH47344.1 protein TonB [Sporomusa sp. KB1]
MTYAFRWHKAVTVSVCLHVFLLAAAGYLLIGLTSLPPLNETLVEMELVSFPSDRSETSTLLPQANTQPVQPAEAVVPSRTVLPANEPEAVVAASDLSMTEAESTASLPVDKTGERPAGTDSTASAVDAPATGSSHTGIASPGILSKVDPAYPSAARKAGLEGTVLLRIQILATGQPGDITIARSSGYNMLDEAAIAAVAKWRFVPAKDRSNGRTVACITSLPVLFRLNNANH